jgi:diaminohydroxyphosphoribosylaminopyrimidine deaminase/5-amino-6-(5-phosphoribosylamino)uracil reductase
MKTKDEHFMRRAMELAAMGLGKTSPNPAVGAVVVKNGRIVGEGYHRRAGGPHAEIVALRRAGRKARGADLYITLEPCCHFGKTPPCCDAIITAGVRRVVVGTRDPNPLVDGKGIKALKAGGIKIQEGVFKKECEDINRAYNKWIVSGIPYVTMKVALSLDGKIGMRNGESKWITNEQCRSYVHRLRSFHDAVLVGCGTAQIDNPKLTARVRKKSLTKPVILLDEKLILKKKSNLFRRRPGSLIVATTSHAPSSKVSDFKKRGHNVILCRATADGYIFLPHLLGKLGAVGITSVLVEGGGKVFSDFLRRNLADRLVVCVAPKIIGAKGRDWLPLYSVDRLKDALNLRDVKINIFGDNIVVEGSVHCYS